MNRDQLLAGPSCLTNAAEDEPLFVLRANDPLAADLVEAWAVRYIQAKGRAATMTTAQGEKALDALNVAHAMRYWKARNPET